LEYKKTMDQLLKTPGIGVDFHMHTVASDGMWLPETLVATAAEAGIKVMTVSDHDTLGSVRAVKKLAEARGIRFIPGVEITIGWKEQIYHMLVFNYDLENKDLQALLADTQAQMDAKQANIIHYLKTRGYKLEGLDSFRRPDGHFLTIDIGRALVKGGEVRSLEHGLDLCRPAGLDRICFQDADKALSVAVAAGGVPVIAHPGRAEHGFSSASSTVLQELQALGLAGLEAYHPSHSPETIEYYLDFARRHKMLVSAGNDSHTEIRKPTPWNPQLVRGLLERFDVGVPELNDNAA
jgi:predicted metal-dependent phosphoesterase TrpH